MTRDGHGEDDEQEQGFQRKGRSRNTDSSQEDGEKNTFTSQEDDENEDGRQTAGR